jgi:cytochrome P450
MTGLLENKVVIVAGLGGIGNGLARRYADEGALLVIGERLDGAHFCLGANLARVEATAIVPEVLSRMTDLELAGPVGRVRSTLMNGIHSMPVRFKAAALAQRK